MVTIDKIEFANEFRSEKTSWLLSNITNKIVATIDISISTVAFAQDGYGKGWEFFPPTGYINPQEIIRSDSGIPFFVDFKTGDVVNIINSGANDRTGVTITKIDDTTIRVVGDTFTNAYDHNSQMIGTKAIEALNFYYNLIENNEGINYNSKIDNSVHKLIVDDIDASDLVTVKNLLYTGLKSWQIGSATIKGLGIDTYSQKFRITHTFYVLPYYRDGEFVDNIQALLPPELFADINTLKYIYKIEALYSLTNPNQKQQIESSETLGNVGWFNENFNNVETNYSVDSIVHKRPDTTILDSVEASTTENTFRIIIKNLTDTPFSNSNTKLVVGFSICPDEDEYTDPAKTIIQNFAFDRCLITLGGASANGDNFGTDEQVLKTVSATFISSSEIQIDGKIAMTSDLVSRIEGLNGQNYIMFVEVQDHTLDTDSADLVTLLADADLFSFPIVDDGLITFTNKLIEHNDPLLAGATSIEAFPGDEIIVSSIIKLDLSTISGDDVDFKSLFVDIIAEKTGSNFNLESFEYDFSNDTKVSGVTYVNFTQNRAFKLPLDDDRRKISIQRRADLDSGIYYFYEVKYPLLFRWEYWEALAAASNDFFDTSEPNNGKNHFWHNYDSLPWQIKARVKLNTSNEGETRTYQSTIVIDSNDYDSNADWTDEYIKAYDLSAVELVNGGTKYVLGYQKTRIEAFFKKTSVFLPADIAVVIWIEVFEAGGITGRTRISSEYDVQGESWFESVDSTPRVKLTFSGGDTEVTAEAILDNGKIPDAAKFRIYARVYDKTVIGGKKTEDDIIKTTEDGDAKTIE